MNSRNILQGKRKIFSSLGKDGWIPIKLEDMVV